MVILVPRQLRMSGMTGNVPYYGGRFSPAQAYAASHPPPQRPVAPPAAPPTTVPAADPATTLAALDQLLAAGLVNREEYDDLRARITS
jgi:hypothetical protein